MSDNDSPTRRGILKTGAMSLAAAGLAAGGVGTAGAQEDGGIPSDEELFVESEASEGLMFNRDFVPNGLFTIASPVIDFTPDVPEVEDELFDAYNARTIRYIRPGTRNVTLYPDDQATIGPYEEEFGFVVDDDFVATQDDFGGFDPLGDSGFGVSNGNVVEPGKELVVDGEQIEEGGLDAQELRQLRPTIFALEDEATVFGEERMVDVRFSPVPEDAEQAIFEEFETEIFGGPNPFRPGGGGALDGTPTPTPGGGNQSGTPTEDVDEAPPEHEIGS